LLDVAQHVDAGLASLRTESRKRIKVVASLTIAERTAQRIVEAAADHRHRQLAAVG
jgi:hypothetical protein